MLFIDIMRFLVILDLYTSSPFLLSMKQGENAFQVTRRETEDFTMYPGIKVSKIS